MHVSLQSLMTGTLKSQISTNHSLILVRFRIFLHDIIWLINCSKLTTLVHADRLAQCSGVSLTVE